MRSGKITINGKVAALGDRALATDRFVINGKTFKLGRHPESQVMLLHKPLGTVVSRTPVNDIPTVFSLIPPPTSGRWIAVGRLDVNTSGLLILCTDGNLANRLGHPSFGCEREYLARVDGRATPTMINNLLKGVCIGREKARFEYLREHGKNVGRNHWYRVILREGRNRLARRLWQSQGLTVNRLKRARFAHLKLKFPVGTWRMLNAKNIARLYRITAPKN